MGIVNKTTAMVKIVQHWNAENVKRWEIGTMGVWNNEDRNNISTHVCMY